MASQTHLPGRLSSPLPKRSSLRTRLARAILLLLAFGFVFSIFTPSLAARDRWSELNIGPFYIDYLSDGAAAREDLVQLEQLRWVLGGLLESQDLHSLWPVRIVLSASASSTPGEFVWQNGQSLFVCPPSQRMPLGQVAGLLLDQNTPRLPAEVESGLRQLFDTLTARGSRVTWGGAPSHPDLAWARMQLFATRFEYATSFHIFVTALKSGSTLQAAERNAFGKDVKFLDDQTAAVLASHDWQPVSVSGRPLDPKRDFGEHSLDPAIAEVYLADAQFARNPKAAEAAFKSAVNAGGAIAAIGYEGLAAAAKREGQDPQPFLESAIKAGSRSAPVYIDRAVALPIADAMLLVKRAGQLNPLWAEPLIQQSALTEEATDQEALLKKAVQLDPRNTAAWIDLAKLQTELGNSTAAQGSWLRAEDSAPNEAERSHVHQLQDNSEGARLDAAEKARRRDRESAHRDDQLAQQAELDRIHAAEQKANRALEAANGPTPADVVPWNQTIPEKKLAGTLLSVDCLARNAARLSVKDKAGKMIELYLKDVSTTRLSCGPQQPARHTTLSYAAEPDERFHTAGTVLSMQIQ